jgi:N,N'-diacetylchitobiose transport system permease protein
VIFTGANVGLTMILGTLLALLIVRTSTWVRLLMTAGLVLVWAMPPVVAVQVWSWMTNSDNGVLNYLLGELHVGNFFQHDWYATPFWQLTMVTTLIVWEALPFVAITLYAALSQVPHELVEAAEIDGARSWRVFKDVTMPVILPILLILTSLSILWDFGVFTQPFLLIGPGHMTSANYLMGIYVYEKGYNLTDFGRGAAISILMLVIVAALSIVYVRRMLKMGEAT